MASGGRDAERVKLKLEIKVEVKFDPFICKTELLPRFKETYIWSQEAHILLFCSLNLSSNLCI